jgi:hypothetical protein
VKIGSKNALGLERLAEAIRKMAVRKEVTYQELLELATASAEGKRHLGEDSTHEPLEMFENERYRPGIGWSSGYLLATERTIFSDRQVHMAGRKVVCISSCSCRILLQGRNGTSTFTEFAQKLGAEDAGGWQLDRGWMNVCNEGWQYANDFSKFEGHLKQGRSNCKAKTLHFVRRS